MENEAESSSTSALAWRWAIEALASLKEVKPSLLHDVIDKGLELPEDVRKNGGEMVALKCLEGLFVPLNDDAENGPRAQESKVVFDSSESCESVVKRVCQETPRSVLRVAGPDMSKWDVSSFIAQKRASMRCTLHQLKESILNGTRPYADFLMLKSGMIPIKNRDSISQNNDDLNECSRRLDSSSSDPQAQKEKSKGNPLILEDERKLSVADPSSPCLLPSKRSSADLTSEDEARELPGCDDGYVNVKKLKQHSAHTLYSGQEVASSHGTGVLEDSPERVVPQSERDDMDTDHLDGHQMTSVEDKAVEKEHFGSKKSGQVESGTPCYTMPDQTPDGEMHEVIGVEKAKDGSELPIEPIASNSSPAEENLYDIFTVDPERGFGDDINVNEMDTMSHSGFLQKTVANNIDVGIDLDEEEKDMLSDGDGYHNERIDIAVKKKEFLSSQCMVDHDSFSLADRRELTVCVKCNEDGQLLSCKISDCPLVVHDKCLGSSARVNDGGDFSCPFCSYSLAILEYLEAKKFAALAKKNVATFIRTGLEHQSIVIKEALQQNDCDPSRKAGAEYVAKICEDVDFGNKGQSINSRWRTCKGSC